MIDKDKLTPVEKYNGIWLKRDDYFVLGECNGGKLRQAMNLIEENYSEIKTKHFSEVVCSASIKSPQSAIISEVAKYFNLKCKIVCYKTKKENRNLSIAQSNGAIILGVKSGYNSVIESHAKKERGFFINMGFKSEIAIDSITPQVQNIPDNLDYLVLSIGSAMNFIGILKGLKKYNKKVGEVIGVFVGKSPKLILQEKKADSYYPYTLIKSQYSYGQELNIENGLLDPIYEAKAWEWLSENLDLSKNILFWIIGKRNMSFIPQKINYV